MKMGAVKLLRKPCANCPFRKVGAIELAPGRLDEIIAWLLIDDLNSFPCHVTVHSKHGGDWEEDVETGESIYKPSGNEQPCVGSQIYLLKRQSPSVMMRMLAAFRYLDFERLREQFPSIID